MLKWFLSRSHIFLLLSTHLGGGGGIGCSGGGGGVGSFEVAATEGVKGGGNVGGSYRALFSSHDIKKYISTNTRCYQKRRVRISVFFLKNGRYFFPALILPFLIREEAAAFRWLSKLFVAISWDDRLKGGPGGRGGAWLTQSCRHTVILIPRLLSPSHSPLAPLL